MLEQDRDGCEAGGLGGNSMATTWVASLIVGVDVDVDINLELVEVEVEDGCTCSYASHTSEIHPSIICDCIVCQRDISRIMTVIARGLAVCCAG